jgi:hypothetical protein
VRLVVLQLPVNLGFSAESLSHALGRGSTDGLRRSIERGFPHTTSSSTASAASADLHNHLFHSDRQQHAEVVTFLQVCLLLAARHKLQNINRESHRFRRAANACWETKRTALREYDVFPR